MEWNEQVHPRSEPNEADALASFDLIALLGVGYDPAGDESGDRADELPVAPNDETQ